MDKSEDISLLATAMALAQPSIKTALMDSTNPFFKSKYADLGAVWDAVRGSLQANKLAVSQLPDHIGQEPALTTMLIHASGQWISATYPLMVNDKDHTPQGYGSALTYARRYGLSALLGVIADTDDDGNAASGRQKPSDDKSQADKHPSAPVYVSPHVEAGSIPVDGSKHEAARKWALGEIPRIKTMDRAVLDRFGERFKKAREELKVLDPKTSVELEKAMADRLEQLFA